MTGPKRVSERQFAANRKNALRSTGPKSPEGKAVSARNALKPTRPTTRHVQRT